MAVVSRDHQASTAVPGSALAIEWLAAGTGVGVEGRDMEGGVLMHIDATGPSSHPHCNFLEFEIESRKIVSYNI